MTAEPKPQNDKTEPGRRGRRLSRYQQARQRRLAAERSDSRFYRAVFSLAGIGTGLAIILAVIGLSGPADVSFMSNWLEPWMGSLSKAEVFALALTGLLGSLFVWRITRRSNKQ